MCIFCSEGSTNWVLILIVNFKTIIYLQNDDNEPSDYIDIIIHLFKQLINKKLLIFCENFFVKYIKHDAVKSYFLTKFHIQIL